MQSKLEIPNTPIHNAPPPLIQVAGTHGEMGRQIGEERRTQIQHSVANAHVLLEQSYDQLELTWEGAQIQARKYLPFVEERYPQYVDEMRGIAEGATVAFDDVMALNVMEAMTMDALHLTRCTSFAVNEQRTADGHVLAAHTEDWVPEDEDDVYVVAGQAQRRAAFPGHDLRRFAAQCWLQRQRDCAADRLGLSHGFADRHSAAGGSARGPGRPPDFRRDRPRPRPTSRRRLQPY